VERNLSPQLLGIGKAFFINLFKKIHKMFKIFSISTCATRLARCFSKNREAMKNPLTIHPEKMAECEPFFEKFFRFRL
jgi:hypothetical protein